MRIRNALVFTEDQRFEKRDVFTVGGRILTQKEWETLRRKAGIHPPGWLPAYPRPGREVTATPQNTPR